MLKAVSWQFWWALPLVLLGQTSTTAIGVTATDRAPVEVKEWTVPWEKSRPRDPYVAPDGMVWFVGQAGNYVARLEPSTGRFTRFEIDSGTYPHNLIVDSKGMIWYAGNGNGMIGRLDPTTSKITRYPMPDPAVRDPHTLVFDAKGDIWFTAQQSAYVGRLSPATGKIDLVKLADAGSRPYGIVVDGRQRIWFNLFGVDRLAMLDPATMQVREFKLPNERARGRRIEVTSDGTVWYVDYSRGMLARLDPATGQIREWPCPGGPASLPYGMAVDHRDRIWLVESGLQPNRLVGFNPVNSDFFSLTPIGPAQTNSIRHMYFHRPTRELWFGTDANTIGRAKLPA